METNSFNPNTPIIDYCDLAQSAEKRLKTLHGLAVIMTKPLGLHKFNPTECTHEEWLALRSWLRTPDAGDAISFWRADTSSVRSVAPSVRVLRVCDGHILIGTEQMLRDLASSKVQIGSPEPDTSIDRQEKMSPMTRSQSAKEMWCAARRFVAVEIGANLPTPISN